jgi:surfactin synthase thioesterase subunit
MSGLPGTPHIAEGDVWVGLKRSATKTRLRLLAFSYAGAGASVYRRWPADVLSPESVEFVAVQLPGRESRRAEPLYTRMAPLIDSLERWISPLLDIPVVLFGYSMGAVVAYELTLRISCAHRAPAHLIVAARKPPHLVKPRAEETMSSAEEIMRKLRKLGGVAPQLLVSDVFEQQYLPVLQADFCVVDNFHREWPQVVPSPLLALAGARDPDLSLEQVRAWSATAGRGFDMHVLDDGHFFLHSMHERVLELVNGVLAQHLGTSE